MSALKTGQKAQWTAHCALVEVDIDTGTATIRARSGDGPTIKVLFSDLEQATPDACQRGARELRGVTSALPDAGELSRYFHTALCEYGIDDATADAALRSAGQAHHERLNMIHALEPFATKSLAQITYGDVKNAKEAHDAALATSRGVTL